MMHRPELRKYVILTLGGLLGLFSFPVDAATSSIERNNLKDVAPIVIVISSLPDWLQQQGTTRGYLRGLVATRLDDAQIKTSGNRGNSGGTLVIVISASRLNEGAAQPPKGRAYFITCNVSLMQGAFVLGKTAPTEAITWTNEKAGWGQTDTTATQMLASLVNSGLSAFISDYKAVNPVHLTHLK